MNKILVGISLIIAMTGVAIAQTAQTGGNTSASNTTSASKQGRQVDLQSGTHLAARLENTLDARHAKAGDRVVLKTTQALKQNGEVVVPKGSRLIGHVTDVQQRTKNENQSVIGIAFDRLQKGSLDVPITATITSITQARSQAHAAGGGDLFGSQTIASSSSRASATSSGQGGGLLGGVGNTVGGVVNTTTATVGNVAGSATTAVGSTVAATTSATANTTGNLAGSLRGLQITQSSDASAQGGSTLSLNGGNLRLESGTTFNLSVSNRGGAGTP